MDSFPLYLVNHESSAVDIDSVDCFAYVVMMCLITLCLHTFTMTLSCKEKNAISVMFENSKIDFFYCICVRDFQFAQRSLSCFIENVNSFGMNGPSCGVTFHMFDGNRYTGLAHRIWELGHAITSGRIFATLVHHNDTAEEFRVTLSNTCHGFSCGLPRTRTIPHQFDGEIAW